MTKPDQFHFLKNRISAVHVAVVLLSTLMTIAAWWFSQSQLDYRTQARFASARDQTMELIIERMQKYEDALWSGVATMDSHGGEMSLSEWRHFASSLRINEKYPGINGIGVIDFVPRDTLPLYLDKRQAEQADFNIYPQHDHQLLLPISFIEPVSDNAEAVGLDVAHETNRRVAALTSRDRGTAQITGPIFLVQDEGHTPGFLFYAPFYQDGAKNSVAQRRKTARGAVYAPFVVRKLMEGLLAKEQRSLRFSIRDQGQLIYDEHRSDDPYFDPNPMFQDEVNLDIYGRRWVVDVRSNLQFRAEHTYAQPLLILVGGLIIEALLISMIVMMARTNARAIAYADRATAALRRKTTALFHSNAELAKSNRELEQIIDVTSFDLRAPLRDILATSRRLREDLSPDVPAKAGQGDMHEGLSEIHEQARQAHDLLKIMGSPRPAPRRRYDGTLRKPKAAADPL